MSTDNLLTRLTGRDEDSPEAWAAVAATPPQHESVTGTPSAESGDRLSALLDHIQQLAHDGVEEDQAAPPAKAPKESHPLAGFFLPRAPRSLSETGMTRSQVESLTVKYILAVGESSGRDVSEQIKLPFLMVQDALETMKQDQIVVHRADAPMNDYVYQLTEIGRERARRQAGICSYFGAAPVQLEEYIESVARQSLTNQKATVTELAAALSDLLISERMLKRLGPAINSGRGLFLFGAPGNGKTSIAERITAAFGQEIWIPRAIGIDGDIMRVFDPSHHIEAPLEAEDGLLERRKVDKRWIRIRRPTIVVGGELTLDELEVTINTATGVSEAPVQLKSNCGTLVIDDFGRQRMSTDALLNRWIVPLEKRYDFLNMVSGKKIQVPFDQLIIFSTNLEPRDLVDDAFLRRIPYKIEVTDPSEEEYRHLFKLMSDQLEVPYDERVLDYLIKTHYKPISRPFRCCQPRDLILQIRNYCRYVDQPPQMTEEMVDIAVENYFAVM